VWQLEIDQLRNANSEAAVPAVASSVVPVVSPVFSPIGAAVDTMRYYRDRTDGGGGPGNRSVPNHAVPAHTCSG
jgi:hypothetical protein